MPTEGLFLLGFAHRHCVDRARERLKSVSSRTGPTVLTETGPTLASEARSGNEMLKRTQER